MPVIGQNRKAKPCHVFEAMKDRLDVSPRPRKYETFAEYLARIDCQPRDPILILLVELGCGEPDRREYMRRISDLRESIYQFTSELDALWSE